MIEQIDVGPSFTAEVARPGAEQLAIVVGILAGTEVNSAEVEEDVVVERFSQKIQNETDRSGHLKAEKDTEFDSIRLSHPVKNV